MAKRYDPILSSFESVTLRPVTAEDDAFLLKVYASTRAAEMAATGWLPVQQRVFINTQYKLQKAGYQSQFPNADHVIIQVSGEPVGRMMVDRTRNDEMRGVDIAIQSEYRNSGIGTYLVQNLLKEATAAGKPFRIQVEKMNRAALRLYDRLGFSQTAESATHITMEWLPR